jgi:AraC family transcriptional regulator
MRVETLPATEEGNDTGHVCDAIEILIPGGNAALAGTYRTAEGREFRAFVRAPMIAVIPPGQTYRVRCQHADETLVLQIAADFFDAKVRAVRGEPSPQVVARYAAFDPFMREVGNALQEDLQHSQPPNPAYLEPLAGVIAVHLARHYGSPAANGPAPVGLPQHKLKRVQAFIEAHLAEVLHVDRLAAEVRLSPFHFARMFKLATGQAPHLYVLMQRVDRDSESPLIEVAARTGFCTQGHFTGVFRRYTGTTPRACRLACRAERAA